MKFFEAMLIFSSLLILTSCGGKSSPAHSSDALSVHHNLINFLDVNNKSTLDLTKLINLPRKIDLKDQMTAVKQQGERGTCSFFAAIALIESAIKRQMNIEVNLSEEYLNYAVKSSGQGADDEGGFPGENLNRAIKENAGFLLESDWPYQMSYFGVKDPCIEFKSTDPTAPKECFTHNPPSEIIMANKIDGSFFKSEILGTDSINELILELGTHKTPMTLVLPVHPNGWGDNGDIVYTEEMRNECIAATADCGMHVIVLTGYDLDKQVFFFKNSWGKEWGHEGYGELPFNIVDRHASLVFVEADLNSDIPKLKEMISKNVEPLTLNNLILKPIKNIDQSIELDIFGEFKNIAKRTVLVSSTMVEMDAGTSDAPTMKNTTEIILPEEEMKRLSSNLNLVNQRKYYFSNEDQKDLTWNKDKFCQIKFTKEQMETPTLIREISNRKKKVYIRTSIYTYDDDVGYKLIQRVFN